MKKIDTELMTEKAKAHAERMIDMLPIREAEKKVARNLLHNTFVIGWMEGQNQLTRARIEATKREIRERQEGMTLPVFPLNDLVEPN